jgi:hypothetical protein
MKLFAILPAALLAAACVSRPPIQPSASREEGALPEPGPEQPVPAPQEPAPPGGPFVVSEEVYEKTFGEIERFISSLNRIIREEDYEGWLSHLSEDYIRRTSDQAWLDSQSESPLLQQANIRLRDLHDYFTFVVVPSRTQAELAEIEFLDENHVKALSKLHGRRAILYLLVRDEGQWKIGIW